MITVEMGGFRQMLEMRDFVRMVRDGLVPPEALVCGELLTGGAFVRAEELRVYAALRGLEPPQPREDMPAHQVQDLAGALRQNVWNPGDPPEATYPGRPRVDDTYLVAETRPRLGDEPGDPAAPTPHYAAIPVAEPPSKPGASWWVAVALLVALLVAGIVYSLFLLFSGH